MKSGACKELDLTRRSFIGGSDACVIMGTDEAALVRLWREKRGEAEPEDLSGNLIVRLGTVTEDLNRSWYEAQTGKVITDSNGVSGTLCGAGWARRWMAGSRTAAPCSRPIHAAVVVSEEAAAAKYMPQLQHNMWVVAARSAVLSVITGGGKWVEIKTNADPLYQHLIITAERKFWRCVEGGEPPALFSVEPPKPRIEAVRIVDMTASNA